MKRMQWRTPTKIYHVFILLAPHFDEEFVIACLAQLRGAGLGVGLTGLYALPIQGGLGMTLQPDVTVGDLLALNGSQKYALIMPGSAKCLSTLMADARVVELITNLGHIGSKAILLTIPITLTLLRQAGMFLEPEQMLVVAEWMDLERGIGRLVKGLSSANQF